MFPFASFPYVTVTPCSADDSTDTTFAFAFCIASCTTPGTKSLPATTLKSFCILAASPVWLPDATGPEPAAAAAPITFCD